MAPFPSRKDLEAMKRADLQRVCKEYGVRANLKSEALIDLLLETQSAPTPQMRQTRRSVSTRVPSKAGPSRVSSMIVHDIDEEEENDENDNAEEEAPPPQAPVIPLTRTRKAKETQVRLGVGRPRAVGGEGARAVTRSSTSSRSKRMKPSKSMIPTEATIEEEPEEMPESPEAVTEPATQPVSSPKNHEDGTLSFKQILMDALKPLQHEILALKSKLSLVDTIKSDIADLRTQFNEVRKLQSASKNDLDGLHGLPTTVESLKQELSQLKESLDADRTPPQPSTPKARSTQLHEAPAGFGMPSKLPEVAGSPSRPHDMSKTKPQNLPPHPGIAGSTLGKRPRDSISSDITGVVEAGQEDAFSDTELAKTVVRPTKKKAKLDSTSDTTGRGSRAPSASSALEEREAGAHEDAQPYTVFTGDGGASDYLDPPPPTNRLPDFFEPIGTSINPPRPRSTVSTSSALGAENQPQGFGFGFLPMSSTPSNPMYLPSMPTFPFPEPVHSPSPMPPFAFRSPLKGARHYGALTQDGRGIDPTLTEGSPSRQRESSSSSDAQPAPSGESVGDPPVNKRTMYGTELEGDTRFGDFGLEGMATDYWASGKF